MIYSKESYDDYSNFVDHFQLMTGGSTELQFVNIADQFFWDEGYRIDRAGGIVPERRWTNGLASFIVMNKYFFYPGVPLPKTREEFLAFINDNKSYW